MLLFCQFQMAKLPRKGAAMVLLFKYQSMSAEEAKAMIEFFPGPQEEDGGVQCKI